MSLAFDIGFALPRSPIKGLRRALSEEERWRSRLSNTWSYAGGNSGCGQLRGMGSEEAVDEQ
jgi:hypothetical protein